MSTASPFKFPETVLQALGYSSDNALESLSKVINKDIPSVLNYPEIKREVFDLDSIENKIVEVIKCLQSK